jgi:hypothetical protein
MFRKGKFVFGLVSFLLVIGLVAGVGIMAYQTGVAQGVQQAPQVAKVIEKAAESGGSVPVPPMYGYGYYPHPYGYPHFGFFPIGGICGSIIFLFFFFGFMRMIFFRRPHHGNHHAHGMWGKDCEGGIPPIFNECHKRAHEAPLEGDEKSAKE